MDIGIDYGNDDYSAVTFAKVDGDGVVVMDTLTGEPADAFISLLRVARHTKAILAILPFTNQILPELSKYLKEVEGLL